MTYQLRRLRLHGLIERIPKTHRYRLTSFGFRAAVFCTRTYVRILRPGLGLSLPAASSFPCSLRRSFDKLEREVNASVDQAKLAALNLTKTHQVAFLKESRVIAPGLLDSNRAGVEDG
jgi:hypothetical protein